MGDVMCLVSWRRAEAARGRSCRENSLGPYECFTGHGGHVAHSHACASFPFQLNTTL